MDATVAAILMPFAAHVAATVILAEYWRSKRPTRHRIRKGDAAKLAAWLATAPTKSTRSTRRSTT